MIVGIGIDLAFISEIQRLGSVADGPFMRRVFTERERAYAESCESTRAESFAGMFAAKEAAFKALAHTRDNFFDLRSVEVLHAESGMPYIEENAVVRQAMEHVGASNLLVSITDEGDFALAIVVAQN
jgi:holo-[acyl-carrier protein] synthase